MKTRFDFVSNSSSSSFILKYTEVFDCFHIGKNDIVEALNDMRIDKNEDLDVKVFDLRVEKAAAVRWFGPTLQGFNQQLISIDDSFSFESDNINAFNSLLHALSRADSAFYCHLGNEEDLAYNKDMPDYVKKTILECRKKLEIKSADEVLLDDPNVTIAIHFGDNEIQALNGMGDESNDDHRFESDPYSAERFIELLFNWLVKHNKIDPKKKELLERYPLVPDYKAKEPDKISWLNDDTYTWKDYVDEGIAHAMLHEG